MSDTASINAVTTPNIQGQKAPDNSVNVKIIDAPQNLELPAQKISGIVIRTESNGTLTIKTEYGIIKADVNGQIILENGAPIDIRLDGNLPPQSAILRALPVTAPPQNDAPIIQAQPIPAPTTLQALITDQIPVLLSVIPPTLMQVMSAPFLIAEDYTLTPLPPLLALSEINNAPILAPQNAQIMPSEITPPPVMTSSTAAEETILSPPITKIPFKTLAAYLISNPLQTPITLSDLTLSEDVQKQSFIQEARILHTNPPRIHINTNEHPPNLLSTDIGKIEARLEGFTAEKQLPILKITNEQAQEIFYAMNIPIKDAPIGTQITLEITKQTTANQIMWQPMSAPLLFMPDIWTTFQDIHQTLNQAAPQMAQAMSNIIPNASSPAQLGNGAMFFLAAMRTGDVQGWLGEKASEIIKRAGKGNLLTRLGQEFFTISRMSSESTNQDWRTLNLPLMWQNDIHKTLIHYRKEHGQDHGDNQSTKSQTRFIMNLSLTKIGKIQIDGLFREQESNSKRLDLILRSENSFSSAMKTKMRRLYTDALSETQISGELSFQDKPEYWVHIAKNTKPDYSADI